MQNGQQNYNNGQSTLQNVCSYSFTANNLFQISLVKDTDPNRPAYKRAFFCFLTLAPGAQGQGGGRTYNFSNKINMKQDMHQVMALANAIRNVARGYAHLNGKFSLFVDSSKSSYGGSQGNVKQVFVNPFPNPKQQNQQNQQNQEPKVSLGFRMGKNNPIGLIWSVPEALAVADVIEMIGKKGIELDMNNSLNMVGNPPPPKQQNQGGGYQQQNQGGGYQQQNQGGGYQQNQQRQPQNTQQPSNQKQNTQQHQNQQQRPAQQQPQSNANDVANNFADGLNNANTQGDPPQSPPMSQMGNIPDDDIPF